MTLGEVAASYSERMGWSCKNTQGRRKETWQSGQTVRYPFPGVI